MVEKKEEEPKKTYKPEETTKPDPPKEQSFYVSSLGFKSVSFKKFGSAYKATAKTTRTYSKSWVEATARTRAGVGYGEATSFNGNVIRVPPGVKRVSISVGYRLDDKGRVDVIGAYGHVKSFRYFMVSGPDVNQKRMTTIATARAFGWMTSTYSKYDYHNEYASFTPPPQGGKYIIATGTEVSAIMALSLKGETGSIAKNDLNEIRVTFYR